MAAVTSFRLSLTFVASTAIAGLLADTWPALLPWLQISLHAAFGVSLLSLVAASVHNEISGARLNPASARILCRRLSRTVYLILYLIFGADQILRAGANAALLQPPANLRDYFICGLVALFAIRVSAVLSVRQPPALQMSPQLARAGDGAAPP